jgi:tRNA/rRNA methyltransferase
MRNMGLSDLVLVSPDADPDDREARRLSTHGEPILKNARMMSELSEAVADCVLVAATSARTGKLIRGDHGTPKEVIPALARALNEGTVALVFGPEPGGLTDAEIARCHHLIHIPSDPSYPALNLAQAVAVCLYELRCNCLPNQPPDHPSDLPANFGDLERMFEHLQTALAEIHFLYGPKAAALMHALRHLIGRARPTETEVGILFGLARQIRWYVEQHGPSEK